MGSANDADVTMGVSTVAAARCHALCLERQRARAIGRAQAHAPAARSAAGDHHRRRRGGTANPKRTIAVADITSCAPRTVRTTSPSSAATGRRRCRPGPVAAVSCGSRRPRRPARSDRRAIADYGVARRQPHRSATAAANAASRSAKCRSWARPADQFDTSAGDLDRHRTTCSSWSSKRERARQEQRRARQAAPRRARRQGSGVARDVLPFEDFDLARARPAPTARASSRALSRPDPATTICSWPGPIRRQPSRLRRCGSSASRSHLPAGVERSGSSRAASSSPTACRRPAGAVPAIGAGVRIRIRSG